MALPKPDEILKKQQQSSTLPSPNDVIPSRVQAKQQQKPLSVMQKAPALDSKGITDSLKSLNADTAKASVTAVKKEQAKQEAQKAAQKTEKQKAIDDFLAKQKEENKSYPKLIRDYANKFDEILYGTNIGRQIAGIGQGALTSTTGLAPEEVGTPSVGSKASKVAGSLLGPLANPAQIPGGINAPYTAPATQTIAGAIGSRIANPVASRIATEAAREAIVGAPIGAGQSLMTGESSPKQLATSAALGAGLGAVGGVAARGLGELAEGAARRLGKANTAVGTTAREAETAAPTNVEQPQTIPTPQQVLSRKKTKPGERAFVQTLEQSDKLTPEVRQGLAQSTERTYEPLTNASTVEKANRRIATNIDEAEAFALNGGGRTNADQIATGMQLIQEFQKRGQTQRAVTLAENLANKLTEAGQTVQAASIWNRLTPEGALLAAQRKVNAVNDKLNKFQEPVKLTEKDANDITQAAEAIQAAGASQEKAGSVVEIMNRLKQGQQITDEEMNTVQDFLADADRFVKRKPEPIAEIAPAELPNELKDERKRDKVLSYLEQQAADARAKWNAKRNFGFAQKLNEPDIVLLAKMATYQVAKGAVKLADFTENLVKEFGEVVRPYANEVFQRAQKIVGASAKHISEGKLERANDAFNRLSGQAAADKEALVQLGATVRKALEDVKNGQLDEDALQTIRDMSQEIVSNAKPTKPMPDEQRFLQSVRSLAKKLSDVETEKVEPSQASREIKKLLQTLSDIENESKPKQVREPLDSKALDELAYGLAERAKPSMAEKVAKSYIRKNEGRLDPADIKMITDLASEVSALSGKAQQEASQDLQAVLNNLERSSIARKLSSAQYLTMLLNPKTQIRNIVGNELMYRLERMSRILATPIDIAYSKITGKDRTITFRRGPEIWSNFFTPTKDYIQGLITGAKAGWRGVNPEGIQSKYDIGGPAFRSKLNPLTYLEKTLGATLKGFDYASYNRAVNQRLNEMAYLDAINNGVKGTANIRNHMQTYLTNLDDNISAIAKKYGDYVTLQDSNFVSQGLTGLKRWLNKASTVNMSSEFGAGNLVVPFAKTPANILLRAIDYSPAGVLKAISQAYQAVASKDTDLTRSDVIDSVSRAVFGTGIGALAWWLADKGVIRGQASKDKDVRNLETQQGLKEFQLNGSALQRMMGAVVSGNMQDIDEAAKLQPGDVQWTYSWAQPASVPIAVGSNIAQSTKEGASGLQTAADAAWSGLNTILDTSVLSGIQQAFQTNPGEDNTAKSIAMNLVKQIPSMFTPAIVNQVNQLIDNKVRETYSPDTMQSWLNPSEAKVPGLAQKLPQRVGTFGQPQTRPSDFFDVFFNPADRTKYQPTSEARFVIDLLKETGDERIAPRTATKTISGKAIGSSETKSVKLTGEQYTRLQSIIGQDLAQRINKINPNLSTDKKIQAVIKALDESGKKGRNVLKQELGIRKEK